jgi:DNA-binding CsgD family transcriptional regulator
MASPAAAFARFLASGPDGDAVCDALHHGLLASAGPRGLGVWGVSRAAGALVLMGAGGASEEVSAYYSSIPLWVDVPVCRSVRFGSTVIASLLTLADDFPALSPLADEFVPPGVLPADSTDVLLTFPLTVGGSVSGAITGVFSSSWAASAHERVFMEGVLSLVSLWLAVALAQGGGRPLPRPGGRSRVLLELSERQRDVLRLLRDGLSVRAVAEQLAFSQSAVKQDVAYLSWALGASSRRDMLERASRSGL